MHSFFKKVLKSILSERYRKSIRRIIKSPSVYLLRQTTSPLSDYYGFDRGEPIDRFYIENFLKENKQCIRGVCLELLNNTYTTRYGKENVTKSDILDIDVTNRNATIIDDLRSLKKINDNTYDCIILTQVLQFIDDVPSAIAECYRILKKGGAILATVPSLSRIDCASGPDGDYWRFTQAGVKYLFEKNFNSQHVVVSSYGNVRSGIYFYAGLAQEDVSKKVFKKNDQDFSLIVTVKAIK